MKCYNCSKEIEENDICPYCTKNQIYATLNFNVKGVTFENEEGKDIQKEIRKIFLEYERNECFEKYSGYSNAEIKELQLEVAEFEDAEVEMTLKEDTYQGKPCIKIYVKKYDDTYCHVGYMPKGLVKTYLKWEKNFKHVKSDIKLVGGKIKQLEYDYITEKDKVEIVELEYGFEVELILYNDENKFKEQVEQNKQKAIKEWEEIEEQYKKEREEKKKQEVIERHNKKIEEENRKKEENQKIRNEEIEKENRRSNSIIFFITAIVSAPFIWMFWKILSFIFWIIE